MSMKPVFMKIKESRGFPQGTRIWSSTARLQRHEKNKPFREMPDVTPGDPKIERYCAWGWSNTTVVSVNCFGSSIDHSTFRRVSCSRAYAGIRSYLFNADFRGRLTCLFPTQFLLRRGRFSPVFWASERRGLGVV